MMSLDRHLQIRPPTLIHFDPLLYNPLLTLNK